MELSQSNYYSYTTGHPSSKNAKPWLITILNNQIIIGKARRKPTASDYTLITYWQCSFGIHATQLYPIQTMLTSPCTNCSLNSNIITNKCTILVPTSHATKFFSRINPSDKSINLNANYLDLIYSLAIRNPIHIPPTPNITISPQILNIFQPSIALDNLQTIAYNNSSSTELTFYTDSSVCDLGNSQCSMGIGWAQLADQTITHTFQAQIKYWPCSYKAELVAVLSAICTDPRNCSIHIYTDLQSVISKYENLSSTSQIPKFLNIPYWSI